MRVDNLLMLSIDCLEDGGPDPTGSEGKRALAAKP